MVNDIKMSNKLSECTEVLPIKTKFYGLFTRVQMIAIDCNIYKFYFANPSCSSVYTFSPIGYVFEMLSYARCTNTKLYATSFVMAMYLSLRYKLEVNILGVDICL